MPNFKRSELTHALAHVGCRIEAGEVADESYLEKLDAARALLEQPRLGDRVELNIPAKGIDTRLRTDVKLKPGDKFVITEMSDLGKHGIAYTLRGMDGTVHRDVELTAYVGHFSMAE